MTLNFWEWEFGEDENGQQKTLQEMQTMSKRAESEQQLFFLPYLFSEEKVEK